MTAPDAVGRLTDVALRLRSRLLVVPDVHSLGSPELLGFAALVLDLSPWGADAARAVEVARRRAPRLPIVVYHPDTPAAMHAAAEVSQLAFVSCKTQIADAREPERLRILLAPLMRPYPAVRFQAMLAPLVRAIPAGPARRFLDMAVSRVTAGWARRPAVGELAAAAGCSKRQLERCCAEAGIPAPHRLVDWLLILWVAWAAAEYGIGVERATGYLTLTRRDMARLASRTIGGSRGPKAEQLNVMIGGFAARLGLEWAERHGGSPPPPTTLTPTAPQGEVHDRSEVRPPGSVTLNSRRTAEQRGTRVQRANKPYHRMRRTSTVSVSLRSQR
jgi:hypothetical protein